MKSEKRILQEAGVVDSSEVFDPKNHGHIKEGFMLDFRTLPEKIDEVHRKEIERHLRWCKTCQAREFLPISD